MSTDRIGKKIFLQASRARVWRALADSGEFGTWFGMKFNRGFSPGAKMTGVISPTAVNAEVAAAQKPYEGMAFEMVIGPMEPERLLSFRWHPNAVDPSVDYSSEPTTLVEFVLQEVEGGVMLTVTESGFDQIPAVRRAKAFTANDGGWTKMVTLVGEYLVQKP
jgi:uncharacterized protein YndB with AHSA1/START domain